MKPEPDSNPFHFLIEGIGDALDYISALEAGNRALRLELEQLKGNMPGGLCEGPVATPEPASRPEPRPTPEARPSQAPPASPRLDAHGASRAQGYTGDACTNCEAMTMKRNGSCLLCTSCGETTGCS